MKFFRWLILILFCLIGIAGVISYFWLRHYIYSPHFTDDIVKIGNEKLEGEFSLDGLDPENWGFKAEEISLLNSGKVAELRIKGFQTYFKKWALLKRTWHMRSIECEDLTVHISRKKNAAKVEVEKEEPEKWNPHQEASEEVKETRKAGRSKRPLIHGIIPTAVSFDRISVEKCAGSVERKKRDVSWEGVSLEGKIEENTLSATLQDGKVRLPFKLLPDWNVEEVKVSLEEEFFHVESADFTLQEGGYAKVYGVGDFTGDALNLDAEFYAVPITSLVKEPDFTTIQGQVNGKVKAVNQGEDTLVKGQLFLSEGAITIPKVLKPVLKLLGDNQSETIKLQQFVGDVKHIGDATTIENLYIEAEGMFSFTGRIELVNDYYRGAGRFGVSEKLYERLPKSLTKNMVENNYFYWTPVRLDGMKENFMKDISLKVARSLGVNYLQGEEVLNSLERNISRIIGDEELYKPVKEKAEKLIDKGLNALEKLFK